MTGGIRTNNLRKRAATLDPAVTGIGKSRQSDSLFSLKVFLILSDMVGKKKKEIIGKRS